jgi:hypothetical protein
MLADEKRSGLEYKDARGGPFAVELRRAVAAIHAGADDHSRKRALRDEAGIGG